MTNEREQIPDRPLRLEITISNDNPALLAGLDLWLQLGLLSSDQVMQLSKRYLSSPLPQPVVKPQPVAPIPTSVPAEPAVNLPTKVAQPNYSWLGQMWQALRDDFSVRWLLFLGVFLVVASSGLLAATYWQKFSVAGQYLVLWGYTIAFWLAGSWTQRQQNLQLTAQALQWVTLLLLPLNFWGMDGLGLWQQSLVGYLLAAIAASALSWIAYRLRSSRETAVFLLACYLHWGWGNPGFPPIAVYLAILPIAAVTVYRSRQGRRSPPTLLVYTIAVLLMRSIFVAGVSINQLGLAIGLCGWLLLWPQPRKAVTILGGGLLFLGWLVAVGNQFPWQATAVSGLSLWWLAIRLQQFWRLIDLAAIFLIGWQMLWLVWRLMPQLIQQKATLIAIMLTGASDRPFSLLSLAWFPYLIFMVALNGWLYEQQQFKTAQFGDRLAGGFGTFLAIVSLSHSTVRSIDLLLSTLTLAVVTRQGGRVLLIYLTHIGGLLTLTSAIDAIFGNLTLPVWATILLSIMVAEWGLFAIGNSNFNLHAAWVKSAWHLGLLLAGLSYALLSLNYQLVRFNFTDATDAWGLLWLITPLALTGIVSRKSDATSRQGILWLSILALGLAQLLTLYSPVIRLISWAVAAVLMLVNTQYLYRDGSDFVWESAAITIGFWLGFSGWLLWSGMFGFPRDSLAAWFLAGAIALNGLWFLRSWLLLPSPVTPSLFPNAIYARTADGWAIALCSWLGAALAWHSLALYWGVRPPDLIVSIAIFLVMGAIAYRSLRGRNWFLAGDSWAFYSLGFALELGTAEALRLAGLDSLALAIANMIFGLTMQLLGDWLGQNFGLKLSRRWHVLPLLYGILGAVLRFDTFTSTTGLMMLTVAFIFIGVGRRSAELKPLLYLGIVGVSVAAAEMLFYHTFQFQVGDMLIAMASLSTSIMYAYRLLMPGLSKYLHLTGAELKNIAHLHWGGSCFLTLWAIASPIEDSQLVVVTTGILLIRYAIMQGRNHSDCAARTLRDRETAATWVYLGLFAAAVIGYYSLTTPLVKHVVSKLPFSLVPWRATFASIGAYFMYIAPWQTWGWPRKPWQRGAIALPLFMVLINLRVVHPISLIIVGGFYIWIARRTQNIRFTYLSLLSIDWGIIRWAGRLGLTDSLWYVTPLALSLLDIAQVDRDLQTRRHTRHALRLLGSGAICSIALFTQPWWLSGIISLAGIFAGLGLAVRAFLYIGTVTFLLNACNQLVILSSLYAFVKWAIGLIVGIILIAIAANFETRREQITAAVRHWTAQLQDWQ